MSVMLSEYLPQLVTAPQGVHKLRGLILEFAMRGKLLPQEPNDEPASEILSRIKYERTQLEAAGNFKKTKPMPPLGEDERPYVLPPTWAWVRLGEVTNFGQTDKNGEVTQDTWVLDLEDIQKDTSVLLRKVSYAERQAKSDKNRFKSGDVLYGKLRPYLNKVILADEDGVCTTEILPVRGFSGVVPRFLMYALKRPEFLAYVNAKSYGMKMPRLGTEDGRLAALPLAPEAEQHRIVAKIDELMALCDQLEAEQVEADSMHTKLVETLLGTLTQSIDAADFAANWQRPAEHFDILFTTESSLDALRQTILQLAVAGRLVQQDPSDEPSRELLKRIALERAELEAKGICKKAKPVQPLGEDEQPYDIPGSWSWCRLAVTVMDSGAGWSPSCESRRRRDNEWAVLKVSAVSWGVFNPDENKALPSGFEPRPSHEVVPGDFLVSRANTAELVARSVVVENCPPRLMLSDKIVRLKLSSLVDARFINLANSCDQARNYYAAVAGGTSTSMKNVSREQILNLAIALPPLAEQRRIVAKVDELMTICDNLKAELAELRRHQERLASTLIESALNAA